MSEARSGISRCHLVAGGFPPGSSAAHDMDYARLRILECLGEAPGVHTTTASDFSDLERWLPDSCLLITYVAGPYPNQEQNLALRNWLEAGGRWVGLHGTSGGKAARVGSNGARKMVKLDHHQTLGSFFLNHPPIRRFRVEVPDRTHPLTKGLPASFDVEDELYLLELQDPSACQVLLTTELEEDPSPRGFGFVYDRDTSALADRRTRVLGYTKAIGRGAVSYFALGHCHSPTTNSQPFVDASIEASGKTPLEFRGSWETAPFQRLLRNAVHWGISRQDSAG